MTEVRTPQPPEAQFQESLQYLQEVAGGQGSFLPAIDLISEGKYPHLAKAFPWGNDLEQKPDDFWVRGLRAEGNGNSVNEVSFSTSREAGRGKSGIGRTRHHEVIVTYHGDGRYSATVDSYDYEAGIKNSKKKTLSEGTSTPPAIPDEEFRGILDESVRLVQEWQKYVKDTEGIAEHHGTSNRTPRW